MPKKISKGKADKIRREGYNYPAVFDVMPAGEVKTSRRKIGFLQKLKNKFKSGRKNVDEYKKGRDRVKKIINK